MLLRSFFFQHRYFIFSLAVVGLIATSVFFVRAFVGSDFTGVATNDNAAAPSDTNVLLGSFILPNPVSDTLVLDGATWTVAAKNILAAFTSSQKFLDRDGDGAFDSNEGVMNSADTALTQADTVLTSASSLLATFSTSEGTSLYGYLDADSDSAKDLNEDIVRQIRNGGSATLTNGNTIRLFATDDVYYWADTAGAEFNVTTPNGIVTAYLTAGFNGLVAGKVSFNRLAAGDNVCLVDGDADGVLDNAESLWYDIAGTCSAFNSGTDFILFDSNGAAGTVFTGTGDAGGTPYSAGFLDANGNSTFDCTRTGTCEALAFSIGSGSFTDGADLAAGSYLPAGSDVPDGIATTGTAWNETGGAYNWVDFSTPTIGGEPKYAFRDSDGDTNYDAGEDIIQLVVSGSADAMSNGDAFATFDSGEKWVDLDGDTVFEHGAAEVVMSSADADLTIGALDGSGTDTVLSAVTAGTTLTAFPANTKFHDAANGAYTNGEDIVRDTDLSGFYNADDLQTLAINVVASGNAVSDSDLAGLYVYEMVGSSCAGSGTDTLLGSDVLTPFLNQAITLTKSAYASSDSAASRTMCLFGNIASGATGGKVFPVSINQNSAVFASGNGPTDAAVALGTNGTSVNIVKTAAVTLTAHGSAKNLTTSYVFNWTAGQAIPDGGGFLITFPAGYIVSGASISCTEAGSAVTGTSSVSGQTVKLTLGGDSVSSSAAVACTVSQVRNPSVTGQTAVFTIASGSDLSSPIWIERDINNVITVTAGSSITTPTPTVSTEVSEETATESTESEEETENSEQEEDEGSENPSEETNAEDPSAEPEADAPAVPEVVERVLPIPEIPGTVTRGNVVQLAEDGSTLYFIDEWNVLRPFPNEAVFLSWGFTFDDVALGDESALSRFPLGSPMPPAPRTYAVKTVSDNKTYLLTANPDAPSYPIAQWITSEEMAVELLGENWNTRILDISVGTFATLPKGPDFAPEEPATVDAALPTETEAAIIVEETPIE